VKARRFVAAVAFALTLCVAVPSAFAGNSDYPWGVCPGSMPISLLDCAAAGLNAALTVL
jgi:starvation-inducible outer membrane lipoprotein